MIWILLCWLLCRDVYSYSACDEVDVSFVIDTDSIRKNNDAIIQFIASIIWSGSSEYSGFSAVVYGDDIPNDLNINFITLEETQNITQRQKEEEEIDDILQQTFQRIITWKQETKSVDLFTAFKSANKQHTPNHEHTKKKKLGYNTDDPRIGAHDGDKVYFIFDYDNKLMFDDIDTMCSLFHHLNVNAVKNDDESIHFLMGQEFNKYDIRNIFCKNKKPEQIKWNTFYEFDEQLLLNPDKMEKIYDITCPAIVEVPEFNGNVNLGNHVQWIDLKTVIKCHLKYFDFHDKTKQDELDSTQSYIEVKDYLNDDNTFKRNDYLLSNPKIFEKMKKMGCTAPVFKIVKIKKSGNKKTKKRLHSNGGNLNEYKILKLYVTLPHSPMEYLLDADVDGDVPINVDDKHIDPYNNDDDNDNNVKKQDEMVSSARVMNEMMMEMEGKWKKKWKKRWKKARKRVSSVKKKIKKKVRKIKQHAKKIATKGKKFLKKGTKKLKKIGKKVLKKAKKVLKKVAKKVKQFSKKVIDKLKKIAGKLLNMKFSVSKNIKLVDLNFKKDFTWQRKKGFKKEYNYGTMTIRFEGDGTITLKYGYWFKFNVGIYFKFFWKILKGDIHIEFKLHGGWDIGAYFNAKLEGSLKIFIDRILNWGYTYVFFIGPIPVIVRPYLRLDARLVTIPFEVYGGIRCRYAEKFALGYIYNRKKGIRKPIKERNLIEKGCKKKFGIGNEEENNAVECPVAQLGFDIIVEPQIGVIFYYIINVFLRFEFILPFRITLPEFEPKFCKLPATTDMCSVGKYLRASFTIALDLNIYLGIKLDIGELLSIIKRLWRKKKPKAKKMDIGAQKKIKGPIKIIKKKSLGCIELKGILKPLNKHYKSKCCKNNAFEGGGGGYNNYDTMPQQIAPPEPRQVPPLIDPNNPVIGVGDKKQIRPLQQSPIHHGANKNNNHQIKVSPVSTNNFKHFGQQQPMHHGINNGRINNQQQRKHFTNTHHNGGFNQHPHGGFNNHPQRGFNNNHHHGSNQQNINNQQRNDNEDDYYDEEQEDNNHYDQDTNDEGGDEENHYDD